MLLAFFAFGGSPLGCLKRVNPYCLDYYLGLGMSGKVAEAVTPLRLRVCKSFAEPFIVLDHNPCTSVTFLNDGFEKTLHDILLLRENC